jgi:opacity protein-like surface antigen
MKKCLTCIITVVMAFTLCVATAAAETKLELGPKLGLSAATMTGDELEAAPGASWEPGYIPGGIIGAFASFALTDKWAIQPEVLYSQKGSNFEEVVSWGDTARTSTIRIELQYVEVPVLVKFTIPQTGRFQPFFYAGPVVAFNTSSSVKFETIVEGDGKKLYHGDDYSGNIHNAKSVIIEGTVGVGVEWKLGSNVLSFEGRYTRSFGSVFEDVDDFDAIPEDDTIIARSPSGESYKLDHSAFSFIIGFGFSL